MGDLLFLWNDLSVVFKVVLGKWVASTLSANLCESCFTLKEDKVELAINHYHLGCYSHTNNKDKVLKSCRVIKRLLSLYQQYPCCIP